MTTYRTMTLPPEFQTLMGEMWAEITQASNRREEAAAQADPREHKLSRVFANSNYLYLPAGRNGRNQEIRFCWSTHRNVAGYFLTWRETIRRTDGKRDMWAARRQRQAAKALAERRANRFLAARLVPSQEAKS